MLRCGGQVVRRESAKLIFAGSIPARTLRFEPCVERQRRVVFCQKIVFKNTFSLLPLLFVPTKSKQRTRRPTHYKKQSCKNTRRYCLLWAPARWSFWFFFSHEKKNKKPRLGLVSGGCCFPVRINLLPALRAKFLFCSYLPDKESL